MYYSLLFIIIIIVVVVVIATVTCTVIINIMMHVFDQDQMNCILKIGTYNEYLINSVKIQH